MIDFKDFAPEIVEKGRFLHVPRLASLKQTVQDANGWIAENGIKVISVKTLFVPFAIAGEQVASMDPYVREADGANFSCQVFRVWFHV